MKDQLSVSHENPSACSVDKFHANMYLIKTNDIVSELELEQFAEVQKVIKKFKMNFTFRPQPDSKEWLLMFSRFAGTNFSRFARTISSTQGIGC